MPQVRDASSLPAFAPGQLHDADAYRAPIDAILAMAALRSPTDTALQWPKGQISFGALDTAVSARAGYLTHWFESRFDRPLRSERVGVYCKKDPGALLTIFAALRAGAIVVPLNPALKAEQFAHIAANCQMAAAFVPPERAAELSSLNDQTTNWVSLDDTQEGSPGYHDVHGWSLHAGARPSTAAAPDDTAILFYTSGSTGQPKGVMVSHHACVLGAACVADFLSLSAADRVLALLPLSFDYGFNQIVSTWMAGGRAVLHDFFLAGDVVKATQRFDITGIAAVPPLWHLLMDAKWPEGAGESLRFLTNSGGALSPDLQNRMKAHLPRADIFAMYGLTEAFRSTYMDPARLSLKRTSMGRAVPFAQVFILNEAGEIAAPGAPGELVHTGPFVAKGYWNDPEKTAKRFRPVPAALKQYVDKRYHGRCVYSGDQAYVDSDGDLYFAGRLDDMIKVLGNRLSPQEVEDAACQSDSVSHAVAFGLTDERAGAKLCLVIEADGADEAALLAALRRQLPSYAVPSTVLQMKPFLRTPNGKIDRPGIRAWAVERIHNGERAQ
jgi:acyl-CoA ligase (AMP-forming) (exosortase A-associated)